MYNPKTPPYADINFVEFHPIIKGADGSIKFDKKVIFPDYFSEESVKIVASKYLCNTAKVQETDLRDMIDRVSNTIEAWAKKDGYIDEDNTEFVNKLKYYQVHQYVTFNSPVYFNIGLVEKPQLSACFISKVEDNMTSITDWISSEAIIFKNGSGSGLNLSPLRSSRERVRQGGRASGPVSFLKASDTFAGIIRSGGTFRRAAKLACLNIDHPDTLDFINCKDKEEIKLRLMKEAGIKPAEGYELSDEVFFQNTNISVRTSKAFMDAVINNDIWYTREVLTGKPVDKFDARDLLMTIAKHAWRTGDPGVQFHDNTNAWNTTPNDGEIEASNPCGEYVSQDGSCNLAALNFIKFFYYDEEGRLVFDWATYQDVIQTVIMAQDTFINNASYPTEAIAYATKRKRALGFGFSNLAAMLMFMGIPYDSIEGRTIVSLLTSLITATAYQTSAKIAKKIGYGYWWGEKDNDKTVYSIIEKHRYHTARIPHRSEFTQGLYIQAMEIWNQLVNDRPPLRNSQVTLVAPTGTTGFFMGCTGFGIEPIYGNIIYKTLSGNDGAMIKYVNDIIPISLKNLGYSQEQIDHIVKEMTVDDIPPEKSTVLQPIHVPIFDTAAAPTNGTRCVSPSGHIEMMVAVQPFISGAISKTINLPNSATPQDIFDIYLDAWKRGLKSVTVYRDGSKTEQVMAVSEKPAEMNSKEPMLTDVCVPSRRKMPTERNARTHKFTIHSAEGRVEGYITEGFYDSESKELGEVFVELAKDGSTIKSLMSCIATLTSIALQHGVSLKLLVEKMVFRRFSPAGFTKNSKIRSTTSIVDYVFKHLAYHHLSDNDLESIGLRRRVIDETPDKPVVDNIDDSDADLSAPTCPNCGGLMKIRLGSCLYCNNCNFSNGSCS